MNRFKLNALISAFVLFSFFACAAASLYSSMIYCEKLYRESEYAFVDTVSDAITEYPLAYDNDDDFDFDAFVSTKSSTVYPYVIAVYDDNANLISRTGSYIDGNYYIDDSTSFYFFIPLEKYLTDDIKNQIKKYFKSSNNYEISQVDYAKSGDDYIPVNIYLSRMMYNEGYKKISLTDYEIDGSFCALDRHEADTDLPENSTECVLNCCFYNLFNKPYQQRLSDKMTASLESNDVKTLVKMSLDYGGDYGEFGGTDRSYMASLFRLGDKDYSVYYEIADDFASDAFHSDLIKGQLKLEIVLFIAVAVILFVLCNVLYSKNKRLENARRAFISAAAHELKTPLAAIVNNSDCVIDGIAPEKNDKYLQNINREGQRMSALVARLLQYNKLASAASVEKKTVSITEIVNNELDNYIPLIENKNIMLSTDIEDNVTVKANEGLIALVIDNFLSNAVKHTGDGASISVTLKKHRRGYKLTIFNEGSGVDKAIKNNIWDAFSRADKARNSSDNSSGMGLAICKQILELHKFRYGFENKSNGVEFFFII